MRTNVAGDYEDDETVNDGASCQRVNVLIFVETPFVIISRVRFSRVDGSGKMKKGRA